MSVYFNSGLSSLNTGEKMAFNNGCSAGERRLVNPKDLRFTHADINYAFTNTRHPSVRKTASLLRYGHMSPNVLAPLHINTDEQGNIWCDNNRRLFSLRHADIHSIAVIFDGTQRPTKPSLKRKLSDLDFMPRIRAEEPGVRVPASLTSGRNACQMQMLPGSVSAGYLNSHEEELGARFNQLNIKSTSTGPSHRESVSSKQRGESNPNSRLYAHRAVREDSVPVGFNGNWSGMNSVQSKSNDLAHMPRITLRGAGVRNPPLPKPNDPVSMPRITLRVAGVRSPPPPKPRIILRGAGIRSPPPPKPRIVLRGAGARSPPLPKPRIVLRGVGIRDPPPLPKPRIILRGPGVRSPPPPTCGRNGYQMERESSVSAGYWKGELHDRHGDNEVHYKEEKVVVEYDCEYRFTKDCTRMLSVNLI